MAVKNETSGRRHQAKEERRDRIIEAGRQILFEDGEQGLSMTRLAERSGVSAGTPYNLFGSKKAILEKIAEDEFVRFHQHIEESEASPLDKIFLIIEWATELNKENPDYTKQLSIATQQAGANIQQLLKSQHVWHPVASILQELKQDGDLILEVDPTALSTIMCHIYSSSLSSFVQGETTIEEFAADCGYGFAVLLVGVCNDRIKLHLRERLLTYQAIRAQIESPSSK